MRYSLTFKLEYIVSALITCLEVLTNVHDQVPDQHQLSPDTRVQVPEPETEEQSTEWLLSKLSSEQEQIIPQFAPDSVVNNILFSFRMPISNLVL